MAEPAESATVTVRPALENSGIRFVRVDNDDDDGVVGADRRNTRINDGDIDLVNGDGVLVRKVGYFLAALKIAGIADAIVEVNADTVDIRYSDIAGLLAKLEKDGLENRAVPCEKTPLRKCAAVEEGKHCAIALPSDRLIVELYIENKTGDGDWCHAEFDEHRKFSGQVTADENYCFGIRVKGDRLPPYLVHRQMLSALGLLTLNGGHQGMRFRGINFTLDVGLRLLKLLMNHEDDDI